MIYSASRRTDLPAFYPDWICEKVRRSRKLEALVLWTKDPRNCVNHPGLRAVIERVPTVVQLTLTGLGGSVWESGVPTPEMLEDALRELAVLLPAGAVRWRFDPFLPIGNWQARFVSLRDLLFRCGLAPEEVVVSFPDPYPKVRARLRRRGLSLPELSDATQRTLLKALHKLAGVPLALCCEPELLDMPGVYQAHCIDGALFDRLYGTSLGGLPGDTGQRKACGCTRSTEIGSYEQTCHHNCLYCYARPSEDSAGEGAFAKKDSE